MCAAMPNWRTELEREHAYDIRPDKRTLRICIIRNTTALSRRQMFKQLQLPANCTRTHLRIVYSNVFSVVTAIAKPRTHELTNNAPNTRMGLIVILVRTL